MTDDIRIIDCFHQNNQFSDYGRFQRPLMPSSKSTLNLSEQLVSHERQLMQLRGQIEDHLQSPLPKTAKGAQVHNYKEKQDFLIFEIKRYETYILTLRTKSVLEDNGGGGGRSGGNIGIGGTTAGHNAQYV